MASTPRVLFLCTHAMCTHTMAEPGSGQARGERAGDNAPDISPRDHPMSAALAGMKDVKP